MSHISLHREISLEQKLNEELRTLRRTHAAVERQAALRTKGQPLPLNDVTTPTAAHHLPSFSTSPPAKVKISSNTSATTYHNHQSSANHHPDNSITRSFDANMFGNNALGKKTTVVDHKYQSNTVNTLNLMEASPTSFDVRQHQAITKWESDRNTEALKNMRDNIETLISSSSEGFVPRQNNEPRRGKGAAPHPPPPDSDQGSPIVSPRSSRKLKLAEPIPKEEKVRRRGKVF
eukprot:PhF_6_TR3336/c0_g1_i1/m.4713